MSYRKKKKKTLSIPLPSTWTHLLTMYFSCIFQHYKPENYSGDLLYYKLSYTEEGKIHELNCSAHARPW